MARRGTGRARRLDVLDAVEAADPRRYAELVALRGANPQAFRREMRRVAEQYAMSAPIRGYDVADDERVTPGRETDPALRVGAARPEVAEAEVAAAAANIVQGVKRRKAEVQRIAAVEAARDAQVAADTASRAEARDRVRDSAMAPPEEPEPTAAVATDAPEAEEAPIEKPKKKPAAKKKKAAE